MPAEVYLDGEIDVETPEHFIRELLTHRVTEGTVFFNSNGGDLESGLKLGELIRNQGLNTSVGKRGAQSGLAQPGSCQSACVVAFAGGVFRFAPARSHFGIHRFFSRTVGTQDLELGQLLSARIVGHLSRMGTSPLLFERMVNAGTALQKLPTDEAVAFGLVDNGVRPARWQMLAQRGALIIQGEQETHRGKLKARVSCQADRSMRYAVELDAGALNPTLSHTLNFSLIAGGQLIGLAPGSVAAPLTMKGSALQVEFMLPHAIAQALSQPSSLGLAFHQNGDSRDYGFEIQAQSPQDRELISSFYSVCVR